MARNRSQSPARAAVAEASEKTEGASLHAKLLNEFIGTLFLVLTIVLTEDPIAIGAVLTVLVYSGGHISGGHYNPAVTFCAVCHGGTPVGEAVQYAAVQVAGAVVGAITASLMANKHVHLTTGKGYDQTDTAIVELVFTAALCSVVIGTTETKNSYFGLAIGFTVLSAALAGGNVSGGAFNPAVVIGTTVGTIYSSGKVVGESWQVSMKQDSTSVFIYVAAQLAGAYLAHVLVRCSTLRKELAEARGAFFLVFTICNVVKSGASSSLAAVSIGSMLMAQVYALGGVSGAHFNPAVTFALYLRGLVDSATAGRYVGAQTLGAFLGAVVAGLVQSAAGGVHVIAPGLKVGLATAAFAEILFTFLLVTAVLNTATTAAQEGNQFFGLAIGFAVTVGAATVGSISGGAFNPAVGTGMILARGAMTQSLAIEVAKNLALYWVGPLTGAFLAYEVFSFCNPSEAKSKTA